MSEAVRAAMNAANANVLTETGLLLRTCEHDVRHPVGHLHHESWTSLTYPSDKARKQFSVAHERKFGAGYVRAECCGPACCPHRSGEAQDASTSTDCTTKQP